MATSNAKHEKFSRKSLALFTVESHIQFDAFQSMQINSKAMRINFGASFAQRKKKTNACMSMQLGEFCEPRDKSEIFLLPNEKKVELAHND